ncbi:MULTISPECIES: hypothetical protein [unclassified Streptomyces]|uniref:hypothetical protein n=1 Tax=unclassified Streptomyces TaxID=2593676 RepID=UPI0033A4AA5F
MILLVLSVVLALVVAGCVCVVWGARGGPRWVRGVAAVTLAAGEAVRRSGRRRGHSISSGSGGGDSDGG